MNEIIIVTPEQLEAIIEKCLRKENTTNVVLTEEPTKYLHSIVELSKFLNCSVVTAHKLKKSGKIRYRQFGRKLIFSTSEILEDLAKTKKNK